MRPGHGHRRGGFTLTELMVAAGVSAIILAAAVSAFVFMMSSSLRMGQYTEMEAQARRLLQQFSQDTRQASNAAWADENTLTLTVDGAAVTYAYDPSRNTFSRTSAGRSTTLASGLTSFDFQAYQITGSELPLATSPAAAGPVTKMIQISLGLAQNHTATGSTSNQVISARCVLRNKKIN